MKKRNIIVINMTSLNNMQEKVNIIVRYILYMYFYFHSIIKIIYINKLYFY